MVDIVDGTLHDDGYPKQICRHCGEVIELTCHMPQWKYDPEWQFYPQDGQKASGICKGQTGTDWYYLHFAVMVQQNGRKRWSHRLAYFKEKSEHF